ncbi:MAG: hypothetical protein S0880_07300 [Actinomycetota bacterium]|nr:hypothetical protein [Actinomycetota bacterium]
MADLDFAILADYARVENGLGYLIAGGLDRIRVAEVPRTQNVGLLMRLLFTLGEADRTHRLEVIVLDADGTRLREVGASVTPRVPLDHTPGRKLQMMSSINFGIPIPSYGSYSIEVVLDNVSIKTIPIDVVPVDEPANTAPTPD